MPVTNGIDDGNQGLCECEANLEPGDSGLYGSHLSIVDGILEPNSSQRNRVSIVASLMQQPTSKNTEGNSYLLPNLLDFVLVMRELFKL